MKLPHLFNIVITASLSLIACSGGEEHGIQDPPQTETAASVTGNKVRSCFENYNYGFEHILSREDILQYVDAAHHSAIKTDLRPLQNTSGYISYSYPGERTHKIASGGVNRSVPDPNTIGFSRLSFHTSGADRALQTFDMKYKKLSEDELQQMRANIEKQYKEKTEAELMQALKFLDVRKHFKPVAVADLGTAAYWQPIVVQGNDFGVELMVLAGTVEFTVTVKISRDNKVNAKTAVAIAKDLLSKCS